MVISISAIINGQSLNSVIHSLWSIIYTYIQNLITKITSWIAVNITDFLTAAIIIFIGYRASKIVVKYIGRPISRWLRRPSLIRATLRLTKYSIIFISILIAARIVFNISLISVVLTATVFSAVLGVVLAPLVGDIINGVFLLTDQPYEIGDLIELDTGHIGFVQDITVRYTKISTLNNTFFVVPNYKMREKDVENYTAEDKRTRQSLEVVVTYESDTKTAQNIMEEAAREIPEVISFNRKVRIGTIDYPTHPHTLIKEFSDNGIELQLRYWLYKPYYKERVKAKIREKIWNKFNENNIKIPYPHSHIVFDETSGLDNIDKISKKDKKD